MGDIVDDAEFTLEVRFFNADDVDRLGINVMMVEVLDDSIFRVVHRLVQDTDELYINPSLERVTEVDRSKEMLQVALQIQAGTAGLHLLKRYGYIGPWEAHDLSTATTDMHHALLLVGIAPGPPVVENTAARAYVERMVNPVTAAQAHHMGIASETAGNLSSYLLHTAEEFVVASDICLVNPNPATDAKMQRTMDILNTCISVKEGDLHISVLTHYAFHDLEGIQHLWFVPDDRWSNPRLMDTE